MIVDHFSFDIRHLLTDSRLLVEGSGTLFFAIRSSTNDGHKYIDALIRNGVKGFVVDRYFDVGDRIKYAEFIISDDVVKTMQQIALEHRLRFDIDVIAITGSNGKTIVKEWIKTVLSYEHNVVATPKSYNSQIGVPLSVWQIKQGDDIAIFEAGISQVGEMDALREVIMPNYGIFTHIGDAHNDGFANLESKILEKLKLFKDCKQLIVGGIDGMIAKTIRKFGIGVGKLFTYGDSKYDTLQILGSSIDENQHTSINLHDNIVGETFSVSIPFTDKASIENALSVVSMMLILEYNKTVITERIGLLDKVEMRLEVKEGIGESIVINDSYSFDWDSLVIAVDYLNNNYKDMKKSVILSDISNKYRGDGNIYDDISKLIKRKEIEKVVLIGSEITNYLYDFDGKVFRFKSTDEFLSSNTIDDFSKEVILVKGARKFEFESIVKALENKNHGTILDVNLNALGHNLKYYKSIMLPEVKMAVMVKAFGYGTGSYEVARTLRFRGIDYLIVAYSDEGKELRHAGVDLPIMVMNPEDMDFDTMSRWDLEPEIYSLNVLDRFLKGISNDDNKEVKIHIKLDTGMHRLGFTEHDVDELITRITHNPNVKIASLFSHLAASDNPIYDDFTFQQINTFQRMSNHISAQFNYKILLHIANTSAITRFPSAHFDMVRLGIGLYGVSNDTEENLKLRTVSSLKSFICQIKNVSKGDSVGYNRNAVMERNSVIGVVPIGYADGYMRAFGNGCGEMFVNGKIVHTIGNICMDMCMIDVTDIDCKEGDSVEIFGDKIKVSHLANKIGTIPYELMTGVSRRVKRVYFNE